MTIADRLVNMTAEAALLGGLMLDNSQIVGVTDQVKQADFADALHGRIYNSIVRFAAKGMRADAVTLRPLFLNDSDARYGDYLDELVSSPAVVGAIGSLASQIGDLAARRTVRDTLSEAQKSLIDDLDVPVDAITARVETAGWNAAQRRPDDPVYTAGGMVGLVKQRIQRMYDNPQSVGIRNALVTEIDDGLGELEGGTYNILAGRPGMGKSAAASSIALGYAMNGHAGVYLNHEMTGEQMGLRITADIAHAMGHKIEHKRIRKNELSAAELAVLDDVERRSELLPMRFIPTGRVDIKRVWSLLAQQKALFEAGGHKMRFAIVDYLGLLGATGADGRPLTKGYDRVGAVSLGLKHLAKDLDIALIALAQLSRGVEQRADKRPMLSDLRESGDLEQDADSVTFLYREEYYLEQAKPRPGEQTPDKRNAFEEWENEMFACRGKLDMIFAKNRHGRVSTRTAKFLPEYSAVRSGAFDEFNSDPLLF